MKDQEDNSRQITAYIVAWLIWWFVPSAAVLLAIAMISIANMFLQVVPIAVLFYAYAVIPSAVSIVLLVIAARNLFRRAAGRPAWEPRPVPQVAAKLKPLIDALNRTRIN